MRMPKMPPPPPPPPAPKAIPTAQDPNVQQAAIEDARKSRSKASRMSTLLSGPLGDNMYTAPPTKSGGTLLG